MYQWNFVSNSEVFIQENALENVVCEMVAILSRPQLQKYYVWLDTLTHWGRVMHICISKLTIIGSDNGLWPGQHQAIIWTNAGILLIQTLRTNFSEILSTTHTSSFKKMLLKMSSAKWRYCCLGLSVLTNHVSQSNYLYSQVTLYIAVTIW